MTFPATKPVLSVAEGLRTGINPNNPLACRSSICRAIVVNDRATPKGRNNLFEVNCAPARVLGSNKLSGIKQQRGSTLLVALVMLVLLTLIAVSAINSTTSSIEIVGNAQFREEAIAAAELAVEKVISTGNFKTTAPAPQNIDINQDGTTDYTVTFEPKPGCVSVKPVVIGDFGVPGVCASSIGAVCFWTVWDIRAVVNDVKTGASVVLHHGVKTIAGLNAAVASCGL